MTLLFNAPKKSRVPLYIIPPRTDTMAYPRLKPSSIIKYAICALLISLTASVCAEALLGKDISLLTPEEIEENLQVHYPLFSYPTSTVVDDG